MEARSTEKVSLTFALYRGAECIRRQTITEAIVKIGKDPRCHLLVSDDLASRMHAVIEVTSPEDVTLIDLGNEPGTFVNGKRVNKCKVRSGDEIRVGSTVLKLESVEPKRETRRPLANPFSAPMAFGTNPFALPMGFGPVAPASNPFVATAVDQTIPRPSDSDADVSLGACTYTLVKSGPDVNPDEVEVAHLASIEIVVRWGTNVLHVDHLTPPRSYYVGEETSAKLACDYLLPSETLGTTRAPLVIARAGAAFLVIFPGATGTVDIPGTGQVALTDLIAAGRARLSTELTGAYELELPANAKAELVLPNSSLTFQVSAVNAGKPVPVGMFAQFEPAAHAYFGMSMLLHLSVVAALAFFMPTMNADDAEAINRDQLLLMQHLLNASAEQARDTPDTDTGDSALRTNEGGTGTAAAKEEGAIGKATSHDQGHKYGVAKQDDSDPHLAREAALRQAEKFGLIGIISAGGGGDPAAPTATWGREDSNGTDAKSAMGNMWGDSIGDSFGVGLGLSGAGEGGGGTGEGIGLGDHGILGHGRGLGDGDGFGNSHGHLAGTYHPHPVPRMTPGATTVNGHIPAEVIQRIVRQNFGRFRLCYENGMRTNPNLQGRVAVKFAIDREGAVSVASDGGSDLPDHDVVSCVVRGFRDLSFPSPEGGIVTVIYPIVFAPGT